MHQTGNVSPLDSGADSTLNSRQDMNMLNSLVVLSSNIHRSRVLALSRSEGAAGMLSTSNDNLTSGAIFLVETAFKKCAFHRCVL